MLAIFCSPTRYAQGRDATEQLGSEMTTLGLAGPALVVAGRSAIEQLSEAWRRTFASATIRYEVISFGGECTAAEIDRIALAGDKLGAQVLVGVGGGKVLDAARGAAAMRKLPFVSCPTIASTDAPTSALSVVYDGSGIFQEYRIHRRNPDLVLVDTTVIAQSPRRLFVAGLGDALSTWFEAKTCAGRTVPNMRGGVSTQAALAIAELCYRVVLADGVEATLAVERQVVTPALERVVEANTLLSGLGFESSGLAAAHAIHNGLTAIPQTHDYLHGEKVAFGTLTQLVLEGQPSAQIGQVLGFLLRVGLPTTLADIGIESATPDTLRKIALRATAKGETIHNEPFAVSAESVADAIAAADALGRAAKAAPGA